MCCVADVRALLQLMSADVQDKLNDVQRLDEFLSNAEHDKEVVLAENAELKVLLDRERQEKTRIVRENTQQLALAQSSSEKHAWIFQVRILASAR